MRISIGIPVYNEERLIPELLRRVREVLDKVPGGPHEVILVDDGKSWTEICRILLKSFSIS